MCTKPMLVVLHRTIRVNYFATFEDFRFIRETEIRSPVALLRFPLPSIAYSRRFVEKLLSRRLSITGRVTDS